MSIYQPPKTSRVSRKSKMGERDHQKAFRNRFEAKKLITNTLLSAVRLSCSSISCARDKLQRWTHIQHVWWKLISRMWNFIVRPPQRMICAMFDNQLLAHPRRAGCCWFYDFEYLIPANSTWLDIYHFPNCLAFHIVFAQSQFLPG